MLRQREDMLDELIETYGEETVRKALGVTERTFSLYGKNGKLPKAAHLVRIAHQLKQKAKNASRNKKTVK